MKTFKRGGTFKHDGRDKNNLLACGIMTVLVVSSVVVEWSMIYELKLLIMDVTSNCAVHILIRTAIILWSDVAVSDSN